MNPAQLHGALDAVCGLAVCAVLVDLIRRSRSLGAFLAIAAIASLAAIALYQGRIERAEQIFLLKYFLASQTSLLWMGLLYGLAMPAAWLGLRSPDAARAARALAWVATGAGLNSLVVRAYEASLILPGNAQLPLASQSEVLALLCILSALSALLVARRAAGEALLALSLSAVSGVAFWLIGAALSGEAAIEPLAPALHSPWLKLHVPTCLIGYGAFTLAAMTGLAALLARRGLLARAAAAELDALCQRAIATGFAFFTLSIVFGALWANEAWGSYWQWDPKESWALIVWLNYAAWLHQSLGRRANHTLLAGWAVLGLAVTAFAFVGVNLLLPGLHSYA
ncbi:cytochrome c biogenesis protein CcsA [Niveibacterium terrae]|uniref:cytochrome c biogenesis protein CcsA n=1 Tax=Niveibacterium terrae TaxID=3373598 RepID=UPI003A954984